jgi:hypothetical protein
VGRRGRQLAASALQHQLCHRSLAPHPRVRKPPVDRELDVAPAQADVGEQPIVEPGELMDRPVPR